MTNSSDGVVHANQQLSALADGELGAAETKAAIDDWHSRPEARRSWHDYHLIGDVLRSDDLAAAAPGDSAFLDAVRRRLAAEPTVLAPTAPPADAPRPQRADADRRRFASYAAMAAGFLVVVAGTLTITGLPFSSTTSPGEAIAVRPEPAMTSPAATSLASATDNAADPVNQLEATVASGQLIRDARLDRYFAAHHQWSSNPMLGGHATYLRPAASDGSGR